MKNRHRILLVDDEKGFAAMLKLNLEAMGNYEVMVVNDPLKAVTTAMQYHPELILLDIIMPNKEGPDVAIEVKETEAIKNTPIIFLTATVTRDEVVQQSGRIGGYTFVAKPSNLSELVDSIEDSIHSNSF